MSNPRFSTNGEWVRPEASGYRVGLTAASVKDFGAVTFVTLVSPGTSVTAGAVVGGVEAAKAAADLYSPLGGRVVATNPRLAQDPEALTRDPEGEGWLYTLEAVDPVEFEALGQVRP